MLRFDPTQAAGSRCITSYGIATVHRTGVGVFVVTLGTAILGKAVALTGAWDAAGTLANKVCVQFDTTTQLTVRTYIDGDASADDPADNEFHLAVFQNVPASVVVDTTV